MSVKNKPVTKKKIRWLSLCLTVAIILAALLLPPIPANADKAAGSIAVGTNPTAVAVNPATNKIYVANSNSNNVTVIDGTDNTTATVAAGTNPQAVAVNPLTNKIYVANGISNNVTVINGTDNSTATVAAGTNPYAVTVNPVTNKIYVANHDSNNVTVINGADNSTTTVAAGTHPYAVAVNPVTDKIYVANYNSNNVTVINGTDNTTTNVAVGTIPCAVAVNPVTNKVYVANHDSYNVTVIDGANNSTTNVAVGTNPRAVAVNPATNKIYVASEFMNNVTVIDGASNTTTNVAVGTNPWAVAVNPATNKIYVANHSSDNVTVIDGANNSTTNVAVGTTPRAVAVNPVTNIIYVANRDSNNVTAIDGASNSITIVEAGTNPCAVAVNPATNKIYVANRYNNNVTVIDGIDNSTTTVETGTIPWAVAVNPAANKIYVANSDSDNITVIDGADNSTATAAAGTNPNAVAVNPATNKSYVANMRSNNVTVIDGTNNSTSTVAVGTSPSAVAVNPATNKIYVANRSSNNVTVIDGTNNSTSTVAVGTSPSAVAVNPATNKIYVANSSDNVTVIDGTNNSTSTVAVGTSPSAVAVNPATNKIYVANMRSNNVTVIDGTNNSTSTVAVGTSPYAVAVNPATNKIYVANRYSSNVTVINGTNNSTTDVAVGSTPLAVAVNPATNKIYVANNGNGSDSDYVAVIEEQAIRQIEPVVTISSLPGDVTTNPSPNFHFIAITINPLPVQQIWYQLDTMTGTWQKALPGGNTADVTLPPLALGTHILYAMATDGQDSTSINTGYGSSPVTGKIAAYAFTVLMSDENDITAFTIPGQEGNVVIDTTAHTVTFYMPFGSSVTALAPAISVSEGATISPLSGQSQDFTNPVTYTVTAQNGTPQDWTVTATFFKTLVSITSPSAITDVTNGTVKTAEALGLPAKVTLVTNDGDVQADVTWDVAACSYDPAVTTEQNFIVSGTINLPTGVVNPNNVSLTTSISVTVDAQWVIVNPIAASINPSVVSFDPADSKDVSTTITWNDATGVTAIKNGGATLKADTDYKVDGTTLTIKKEYLASQAFGDLALTIVFDKGKAATLTIAISDMTPYGITVADVVGGTATVTTDPANEAPAKATVTVSITNIEAGKQFKSITVTDADSGAVTTNEVTARNSYTFTMPAKAVTVTVEVAAMLIDSTGLIYTIRNGEAIITGFTAPVDFNGDLAIPGTLGGAAVVRIENSSFSENTSLISVTIPDGVTSIGTSAFFKCTNMASVTIPDSVTSIGPSAFRDCWVLADLTIPKGITNIDSWVFAGLPITSLTIPNGIQGIGDNSFSWCGNLKTVIIPASVGSIHNDAFHNCPIETIYGFSGSEAQTYAGSKRITFVSMDAVINPSTASFNKVPGPQEDVTATITWNGAESLTDIKCGESSIGADNYVCSPNAQGTSTLTIKKEYLAGQVSDDLALTIVFDKGAAATLTIAISDMTPYGIAIATVVGGTATVTTNPANEATKGTMVTVNIAGIEAGKQFKSITVTDADSGAITTNEVTAGNSYTFTMPAKAVTVNVEIEPIPVSKITVADVVGGTATVTTNPATEAPAGATVNVNITGIETGKQFKSITVTDADSGAVITNKVTAGSCYTFTMPAKAVTVNVEIEPIPVSKITVADVVGGTATITTDPANEAPAKATVTVSITNIEAGKQFKSITVTDADGGTVTTKEVTARNSYTFTMPAKAVTVTVEVEVMLIDSTGLIYTIRNGKAIITGFTPPANFNGDLAIPGTLGGTAVVRIGDSSFSENTSLISVTIPDGVSSIGASAFFKCTNMASVTIPDSVTTIGPSAFRDCWSLANLTIPKGITNIDSWAFAGLPITSLTIPHGVKSIGDNSFSWCGNLKTVIIPASVTNIHNTAFYCGFSIKTIYGVQGSTAESYARERRITFVSGAFINPSTVIFNKVPGPQEDVTATIIWNNAGSLTDVKCAESSIGADNYICSEKAQGTSTLTIKKEYLAGQAFGDLALTIVFDRGGAATLTIAISDMTPYGITIAAVVGGAATITTNPATEAATGATVTVNIAGIEAGKQFKSITVTDADSGAVTITEITAGRLFKFTMPAKAVTVTGEVEPIPISKINVADVVGGTATITTNPATEAPAGATVNVSINNIETGKQFKSITVTDADGGAITTNEVTAGNSYTFTMPAKAVTVNVEIEPIPVSKINVAAVVGGIATVTTNPATEAPAGATVNVNITGIETGKQFKSITVTDADNGSVATTTVTAGESYTFTMPAKAVTVAVALEISALPNPTITGITAVSNVEVAYGTAEAVALAALAATTTITDSNNGTHTVNLSWSIASYDGNTAGNYTATGTFVLPAGVDQSVPETQLKVTATVTVNAAISTDKTLVSITVPDAITGVANGTAKTAEPLGLPTKVTLVTNDGNARADVTWNVDACSYDPAITTEQAFTVSGNVTLPTGVVNPNNVPLTTSVSITVNAATSTDKTLVSITSPADIIGVTNGTTKNAEALGLPNQVTLVTNDGNARADVTWNVDACSYDPDITTEQAFTVSGKITLPVGVVNPNNVDLTTSISVTVNAQWVEPNPTNASINPSVVIFVKDLADSEDVSTTITWNNATSVTDVKKNGISIGVEAYTVAEDTLTIKKEYLETQEIGKLMLTIEFDKGDTATLTIDIAIDECFIATAAFGSKFSWPVEMLRHFRDQYLLSNAAGTTFVKFYYQNSPPIAAVISNNPTLKTMVRVLLAPLVASVFLLYHPAILLLVMILAIVLITLRFMRRRYLLG